MDYDWLGITKNLGCALIVNLGCLPPVLAAKLSSAIRPLEMELALV